MRISDHRDEKFHKFSKKYASRAIPENWYPIFLGGSRRPRTTLPKKITPFLPVGWWGGISIWEGKNFSRKGVRGPPPGTPLKRWDINSPRLPYLQ